MKILVKITKDILRESVFCGNKNIKDSIVRNCAIALAIKDIFPNSWVGENIICIENNYYIEIPYKALNFRIAFDQYRNDPLKRLKMKEISFEVEIPQKLIDQIDISEIINIINKSKSLKLVN